MKILRLLLKTTRVSICFLFLEIIFYLCFFILFNEHFQCLKFHFYLFIYFHFSKLLKELPERCKNYIKGLYGERNILKILKKEILKKDWWNVSIQTEIIDGSLSYADRSEKNEYISLSSRSLTIIPVLFDFSSHLPASASPQPLHHVFMAV